MAPKGEELRLQITNLIHHFLITTQIKFVVQTPSSAPLSVDILEITTLL